MLFDLALDGLVKGLHALPRDLKALDENVLDAFDFFLEVLGMIFSNPTKRCVAVGPSEKTEESDS